jgi:hypothetical protein
MAILKLLTGTAGAELSKAIVQHSIFAADFLRVTVSFGVQALQDQ